MKILHIFNNPDHHFCKSFISAIREKEEFHVDNHYFLVRFESVYKLFDDKTNIIFDLSEGSLVKKYAKKFDYFVLHSFYNYKEPLEIPLSLRKKVLWRTWGDDSYNLILTKNFASNLKRHIVSLRIKNAIKSFMGVGIANYIDEIDIKSRFGNKIKTIIFPYTFSDQDLPVPDKQKQDDTIKVMIGHSGFFNDKHLHVIRKFSEHFENFEFYIPMAYGNKEYIKTVINSVPEKYKDRFHFILNRIDFNDYCALMSQMHFCFLSYPRSYALGNIRLALHYSVNLVVANQGPIYETLKKEGVPFLCFEDIHKENVLEKMIYKEYRFEYKYLKYYSGKEKVKFLTEAFDFLCGR